MCHITKTWMATRDARERDRAGDRKDEEDELNRAETRRASAESVTPITRYWKYLRTEQAVARTLVAFLNFSNLFVAKAATTHESCHSSLQGTIKNVK